MSKAEDRALEAYPHYTAENITEVTNARYFFANGYEQAEKDLALSWKDIETIIEIFYDLNKEIRDENFSIEKYGTEKYFTEILNRFNKSKEAKK